MEIADTYLNSFFKALERSKILSRAILVHIEEIIAEKMEKRVND